MDENQIKEHVKQFVGMLENGKYPQLVMENDDTAGAWKLGGKSSEEYVARINKPENYAYLANRYKKR